METRYDLTISRFLEVEISKVWQAWSSPDLLARWWCPKPWRTEIVNMDFRPGGAFHLHMIGPDGNGERSPGVFLEIIHGEKIVFTSVLDHEWRPVENPFPMSVVITMTEENGGTRYHARVLHQNEDDRKKHEDMGFHDGWNACISQLEETAQNL